MKKYNLIYIFLSFSFMIANDIDVINLINGDLIKGKIIENNLNEYIRIELQGGSILTYTYDQIESIEREQVNTRTFGSNTSNNQTRYYVSNEVDSPSTIMKGTKNIGGSVTYRKSTRDDEAYSSQLLISPFLGYFLTNNLSVNIGFSFYNTKLENESSGNTQEIHFHGVEQN